MNPWRLTIILLSILSLFSCDRDNDNELTVPDLDKPTATTQLTLENAPIMDGSDPYVTEVMASIRVDVDRSSTAYQLFYQLAAGQHNAIVKESGYIVCKQ